jgi:hypothetical protein
MPSFAAYLCLVLSVFVAFTQALPIPPPLSTRNVTIAFNSSEVKYSTNNWEVISSLPSESSQPFTFSNVIGASFGVLLPNGTVAVDYIGVPRSAGAAYAVCIDCDLVDDTKGLWSLVDGNQPDLVNDDQATPTVLFSVVALDPTVRHTITVTNIPDTRFNKTSQITFHSLNIKVADNNGAGNSEPTESSTGTDKPTETSDPTDSSSSSDSAEPTSTSGTATSSSEPTESATDSESGSEPTSSSAPQAEHEKESPTVAAPSPSANVNNSSNGSNGSADSTAATKTQKVSKSVIAVIVVVCVLALFCLATALVLMYRIRRKRAAAKVHDAESQAYGNSQWLPPKHVVPSTGMQEVPLSGAPPRPRNPFEDQFPPNVPLELETPGDSTLMNKRAVQRPRSSFGNGVYDYYDRPVLR